MESNMKVMWLLEMPETFPVQYYSKKRELTSNPHDAMNFKTKEQAIMYYDKYLTQSLSSILPMDHMFIND